MIPTIRLAGVASQLLSPRTVGGRLSAVFTNIHNIWIRCLIAPNVPKNIFSKSKGGTLSPKHLERGGVEPPPPIPWRVKRKNKVQMQCGFFSEDSESCRISMSNLENPRKLLCCCGILFVLSLQSSPEFQCNVVIVFGNFQRVSKGCSFESIFPLSQDGLSLFLIYTHNKQQQKLTVFSQRFNVL